jgi:hypothetical protein
LALWVAGAWLLASEEGTFGTVAVLAGGFFAILSLAWWNRSKESGAEGILQFILSALFDRG